MSDNRETWEYYGKNDPYYAVATIDKFKNKALNEENRSEFFETGREYIEKIWRDIEEHFAPDFEPERTLDYGCGVGRLILPLAAKSKTVVGVDISSKMLEEASKNCESAGLGNTSFFQAGDDWAIEKFDFVHSYIVLQHVKPEIGLELTEKIIGALKPNGIGVLHYTYLNRADKLTALKTNLVRDFPLVNKLRNFVYRGKKDPNIPIYTYDLNKIFQILHDGGCHKCFVRFTYHGMYGLVIFFQKSGEDLF